MTLKFKAASQRNNDLFVELRAREEQGDEATAIRIRQEIVTENIGLVHWFVNRYRNQKLPVGVEDGDLVNGGVIGMYKAIEKFDLSRGVAFGSFAPYWIHNRINAAIRESSLVKLRGAWLPSFSQVSLDATIGEDDRERHEVVDSEVTTPFEITSDQEHDEIYKKAFHITSIIEGERNSDIYRQRFIEEKKFIDIAKTQTVTKQRVHQIGMRFTKRLQKEIRRAV